MFLFFFFFFFLAEDVTLLLVDVVVLVLMSSSSPSSLLLMLLFGGTVTSGVPVFDDADADASSNVIGVVGEDAEVFVEDVGIEAVGGDGVVIDLLAGVDFNVVLLLRRLEAEAEPCILFDLDLGFLGGMFGIAWN